jgi:hypothetical protein
MIYTEKSVDLGRICKDHSSVHIIYSQTHIQANPLVFKKGKEKQGNRKTCPYETVLF